MAITRPSEWLDISSTIRKVVIKELSLSPFPRLFGLGRTGRTLQMIKQGEQALNIELDRKAEIALAANGSLNVAQYLCFNICYTERVIRTQSQFRVVHGNVNTAVSSVVNELSRKFGESIRRFAAMGGPRDLTSLRLLEELAHCENGFLSLLLLAGQ